MVQLPDHVLHVAMSASALLHESLRMRRVDWFCLGWRPPPERRLEEQVPHDPGRELLLHKVENLPRLRAGSSHEVAGVPRRLVQEARPLDGVVDLRLGAPAGPVLREGGRELRVQLGPGIVGQQLVPAVTASAMAWSVSARV